MNKNQKQVLQSQFNSEKIVLHNLQNKYKSALKDINNTIAQLKGRTDAENAQSIVYQLQYQEALKKQVNGILDKLDGEQYTSISEYLSGCYEDGFLGVMYDLHGQGIPLVLPIDQIQVVKAVQIDTKLSKPLYKQLGENIINLKYRITDSISRGIITGSSYADMAREISRHMVGDYSKMKGGALGKAYTIARTEGHRIQNEAANDARTKAKEKGADIVKQWDGTLDARTRPSHRIVDGEIRELDEPFSNGLMFPGDPAGKAAEVINCRCACLQRAKWALDEDELKALQERAKYFGLDKSDSFEDFKTKYIDISENDIYNGIGAVNGAASAIADVSYIQSTYGTNHATSAKTLVENADPETRRVWNKYQGYFKTSDPNYSGSQAYYSPTSDSVTLNIGRAQTGSSYQTPYQVLFHEYGHMTDYLIARDNGGSRFAAFTEMFGGIDPNGNPIINRTGSGLLGATAKKEVKDLLSSIKKTHGVTRKSEAARILIDEITNNYSLLARSDVSDMLEGAGIGVAYPLGVGHGTSYWKQRDNGKEIFAEIFSAEMASSESLACIQKYFPETYKIYREILKVVK